MRFSAVAILYIHSINALTANETAVVSAIFPSNDKADLPIVATLENTDPVY